MPIGKAGIHPSFNIPLLCAMAAASVIYVLLYKAALLWGSNQPNMLVFVVVSLCHNIPAIYSSINLLRFILVLLFQEL